MLTKLLETSTNATQLYVVVCTMCSITTVAPVIATAFLRPQMQRDYVFGG